jgi:hypothetical protein
MSVTLWFPVDLHRELVKHLRATEDEQVAFLFTEPAVPREPLRVAELYQVPPEGFDFQSAYHITLTDEVRAHVIGRAWQVGGCLVEAHSHAGGNPASFSCSDMAGFDEWVPHVRWRLRGRTYVALVFADDSFDALMWEEGRDEPKPLGGVIVDGDGVLLPTGITYSRLAGTCRDH